MFLWYQYKKVVLISLTVIVLGLLGFWGYNLWQEPTFEVQARNTDQPNLWGWAWTSTTGWISFNCLDTDQCGTNQSQYGVSYDPSFNKFEGWAWSTNVGWITFNLTQVCSNEMSRLCTLDSDCSGEATCIVHTPPDPPGYDFASTHCPNCTIENGCTACYDSAERQLYGWAKVLSLGDDGWIKLNGGTWQVDVKDYTIPETYGDFSGWAWNGGTFYPGDDPNDSADDSGTRKGLGWISFSGVDYRVTGKPTKPMILSVEQTPGRETNSLTVIWNSVLGETFFKINNTDNNGDSFLELNSNLIKDSTLYIDDPLPDKGFRRGYQVLGCNIFGCHTSNTAYGTTSPINNVGGLKIDSACFAVDANTSNVNLAWYKPSVGYAPPNIDHYEMQYCVLNAGQTADDCSWLDVTGACHNVQNNGDSINCVDVLSETNSRYNQRYNIHIYRVSAVGPDSEKACNGGTNSGAACFVDDTICTDPRHCDSNTDLCDATSDNEGTLCGDDPEICTDRDLCQPPRSSWSQFRDIRPCPRAGQPEYQEVRPE